ncbi:ribosome maturation factor RimM [Alphaproteobacteria bacterium]|nr:ribosome maturation factor RimM [Alphaproteobacteria bacterium]
MIKSDFFCIGVINSSHGIRGEVKIKSYLDDPMSIIKFKDIKIEKSDKTLKFDNIRHYKKNIIIGSIEGVNNRNSSETFIRKKIYANKKELPPSKTNEYYYSDLINLTVENELGEKIGIVSNVLNFGAGNIIDIKQLKIKENILLPFDKKFFPIVEIDKRLVVSLPD